MRHLDRETTLSIYRHLYETDGNEAVRELAALALVDDLYSFMDFYEKVDNAEFSVFLNSMLREIARYVVSLDESFCMWVPSEDFVHVFATWVASVSDNVSVAMSRPTGLYAHGVGVVVGDIAEVMFPDLVWVVPDDMTTKALHKAAASNKTASQAVAAGVVSGDDLYALFTPEGGEMEPQPVLEVLVAAAGPTGESMARSGLDFNIELGHEDIAKAFVEGALLADMVCVVEPVASPLSTGWSVRPILRLDDAGR